MSIYERRVSFASLKDYEDNGLALWDEPSSPAKWEQEDREDEKLIVSKNQYQPGLLEWFKIFLEHNFQNFWKIGWYYLPTPPLGQDMTHGQFLSGV